MSKMLENCHVYFNLSVEVCFSDQSSSFRDSLCVCVSKHVNMCLQVSGESTPRHCQALLTAMQERLYCHPIQRLESLPIIM